MFSDSRLALRRLIKTPAFTSLAILTLALAIGANTAIFSIADAVLFRPLPYSDPSHLYALMSFDPKTGERLRSVPYEYVQAIEERHPGIGDIGLRSTTMMTVHRGGDQPEWMETVAVTPEYLRVLGVEPVRGRFFEASDSGQAGSLAVITYQTWQRRFGSDETIIGRSVLLGLEPHVVTGILPSDFMLPATALNFQYTQTGRPEFLTQGVLPGRATNPDLPEIIFDGLADEPLVRLRPGLSIEQAQADVDTIVASLHKDRTDRVVLVPPRAVLFPTGRPIMAFVMIAAVLVLLIGCANLANLFLARSRSREHDLGVCSALGATRLRLVRPIIIETAVIGVVAGAIGLIVTAASFDVLLRQVPPIAYRSASVQVDGRVAVFAMALGIVSGCVFAVAPAWWSARLDVRTLLNRQRQLGSWRRIAFGHPMVVAQVALAIVLVFGAMVAGRALVDVLRVPLGFSPDNLIVINAGPNPAQVTDVRGFYLHAVEVLGNRPDVQTASAGGSVPTDGYSRSEAVEVASGQRPVDAIYVLPGYFETVGIKLLRGRSLTSTDVGGGSSAVLSASAAKALFPTRDALGSTFKTNRGGQFVVVGIVNDATRSLTKQLAPLAYVIPPPTMTRGMTLVARTRTRSAAALVDARRAIGGLVTTAVTAVWWSDTISASTPYRNPRFQTLMLTTFAALGIALTALGIFAVVSFLVSTRVHEMGIRLAIGASPASIVLLIVRQALGPVVVGLCVGLLGTQWLKPIAEAQLYAVDVRTPAPLVAAAVAVLSAALLAAYLPARRASQTDAAVVLRSE
jgi:putative ABC transport system permease protein